MQGRSIKVGVVYIVKDRMKQKFTKSNFLLKHENFSSWNKPAIW